MKRIVFFILMLLTVPKVIYADMIIDECNSGDITISNGLNELQVIKRGQKPFDTTIQVTGNYTATNVLCLNETYIIYGYLHNSNAETFYDGFLIQLNDEGVFMQEVKYDNGELDEVKDVIYVDGMYIVFHVEHMFSEEQEYKQSNVLLLDQDLNEIQKIVFTNEVYSYEIDEYITYINYGFDDHVDLALLSNGTILYSDTLLEIEDEYFTQVDIIFINNGYVNNALQRHRFQTNYPGNYTIVHNYQPYSFVVHPLITGVANNEVYNDSINISVSNGIVLLNNELYVNDTDISEPGYYSLEVLGVNEYYQKIEFTINSKINGLINNHSYEEPISLDFTGVGYLNGNIVSSPTIIDLEGDYIFRIVGEKGYSEEYNFSISYQDTFSLIDFIQKIDIYIIVIVVISGVVIIKKSK